MAHQCSRKAQRREEEAKLKKDNVRLVQKLCDVARQSEKRQEAISARPDPAGASVLKFKPQRMKRQQAIFADNLALLHRLESVRSVVPSASQAVESHSRHRALAARLSRSRRPVGMARPFPPSRPGPRRGPSLQLVRPEQSRMESLPDAQPEVTFSDSSEAGSRRAPLHLAEAEAVLLLPALEDREGEDLSRMLPITHNEHGMGEVGEAASPASPASPAKVRKETSDAGSEFPEDFEDPSESESER